MLHRTLAPKLAVVVPEKKGVHVTPPTLSFFFFPSSFFFPFRFFSFLNLPTINLFSTLAVPR